MVEMMNLIGAINELETELKRSGKSDSAQFFASVASKIEKEENLSELLSTLDRLCSSGSIVQYADFNSVEEGLFDQVFSEGVKVRQKLKGM